MKRRGQNFPVNDNEENTGSPETGGPVFIAIGFLRRPHGIGGELLMDLMTDFPERMRKGRAVYLGDQHEQAFIESTRGHTSGFLVRLRGVDSVEAAGNYRNTMVYVRADELPPLPKGEYYHHELVGMRVFDHDEQDLGVLTEIMETGANDVYVIISENGDETLVPVIKGVILSVDLEKREMRIHPPEWE